MYSFCASKPLFMVITNLQETYMIINSWGCKKLNMTFNHPPSGLQETYIMIIPPPWGCKKQIMIIPLPSPGLQETCIMIIPPPHPGAARNVTITLSTVTLFIFCLMKNPCCTETSTLYSNKSIIQKYMKETIHYFYMYSTHFYKSLYCIRLISFAVIA